jgi:hypothetical protein
VNDLARLGQALNETLLVAEQNGCAAHALQGMVPMFSVALLHAYRQLLLIALDEEMTHARWHRHKG